MNHLVEINFKVNLSNYATLADIKNISHIDASPFALKSNLASLKTEIDKLDIDKLVPFPVDLRRLSDVVKNDVVKKAVCGKLIEKVNNIGTSGFALKTKYDTDKTELENKIPDISRLVKKSSYNAKTTEIENKIPSIGGLATNDELTSIEDKIPNISSLVKTTNYDTKISETEKTPTDHNEDKYITTSEFNNLATVVLDARLKQADLLTKTDFHDKLRSLNQKINSNKAKNLLVENELKNLKI